MGGRDRKFFSHAVNHIYQNTVDGINIFYSVEDYLVYFTIFSNCMAKYGITVYGLCLMYDHIHALLSVREQSSLYKSVSETTSRFVKEYNIEYSRKGPLFNSPFGSAVKTGEKKVRTAIAYLYNNPVEKKLCRTAEQYRWNFIAYMDSPSPFSKKRSCRESSFELLKSKKEVKNTFNAGCHLNYTLLKRLLSKLDMEERDILVDYAIGIYCRLDYKGLVRYYGDYSKMLVAINSNTGSEYDISETFYKAPDTAYSEMIRYVEDICGIRPAGNVVSLPMSMKKELYSKLRGTTGAYDFQIKKFLHLYPNQRKM